MVDRLFGKRQRQAVPAFPPAYREQLLSAIATHGLFAGLPHRKVEGLFPACLLEQYQDEEIVCRCPAEVAHHDAFLVLNGKVAVKYRLGDAEHVMELAGFGTLFNVGGVVEAKGDDVGARALGPVVLMMMDAEKLGQMFAEDPSVGYVVVRNLTKLLMEQHRKYLERYLS